MTASSRSIRSLLIALSFALLLASPAHAQGKWTKLAPFPEPAEELLGAAHAACFAMSFVRMLGMANLVPEQLDSKSEVVIDKDGDGFAITSVHLSVVAKIPGIDEATFQSIAMKEKKDVQFQSS